MHKVGKQQIYIAKHREFFFNFISFLNFTILYWFCQISKWISHRYTCVPHPEPSSLLPLHTIPLGRPSAPAPSIQYRASNLDWQLISYMIFTCFNAILPNLPTLAHFYWTIFLISEVLESLFWSQIHCLNCVAINSANVTGSFIF